MSEVVTPDPVISLRAQLLAPLSEDPDYWTFGGNSRRTMGHALFNYPAMMVPQVQGALMDSWMGSEHVASKVFDPFAGSGTVLTECMSRGLDFRGLDINPLATLVMRVKAHPQDPDELLEDLERVLAAANADCREDALDFKGREKWFSAPTSLGLTRIHRAIRALTSQDSRRFFWVCLASAVRAVSNSRTSTFKMHIYPENVLVGRAPDAVHEFSQSAALAIENTRAQRTFLSDSNLLDDSGRYRGRVVVEHGDVRALEDAEPDALADMVMTSPPYGDNRTTVPYGQYAFLPLRWVDPEDLDVGVQLSELTATPYRTDTASLGGASTKGNMDRLSDLVSKGVESLRDTQRVLSGLEGDGLKRFAAFVHDLDDAMDRVNAQVRTGAFQFWTLGERSISGHRVPTTRIVSEMAVARGCEQVVVLDRRIPNGRKRMPIRNDTVATIRSETILVLRGSETVSTSKDLTSAA